MIFNYLHGRNSNIANKILETKSPRKQKELGRQVNNFNDLIWKENCIRIVYEANKLKFLQNENLLMPLLNTSGKVLVEASPYDTIWGIGLKASDDEAQKMETWKGTNWLGFILTSLRNDIELKMDKV
ncbi:MAG: NADAR family protein [Saprospiraceae bacterium]